MTSAARGSIASVTCLASFPTKTCAKKAKLPDRSMDDAYDDLVPLDGAKFVAETA